MIIEILTIVLSSLFVLAAWSFQNSDDFVTSQDVDFEKEVPQITSLAATASTIETKPKKEISEIDDLLSKTTVKVEKPKKKNSEIDDLLSKTKVKVKKPKKETVKIECPECSTIMKLEKTGKMQAIVCKACGLEGELEV
tara:strand:+ start:103 stop:519 length:417 start_codon:yes stop_codon:yes gene_type:complete